MKVIVLIGIIGIIAIAALIATLAGKFGAKFGEKRTKTGTGGETFPYRKKPVMTEPEQILYLRIREATPEYNVLAQVQMSSFLQLDGKQKNWIALGSRIREKSVDFLICRKDTSVFAAIELQDGTHEKPERIKSDEFKRKALKAAGVKLIEFHVNKMPSIEEIKTAIQNAP